MSSAKSKFQIRTMKRKDINFAIDLAAEEGWNPGLHDAECFYKTDPGGFFVATLDERPIGCISAVSYQGIFGFVGFYIVHPEFRGKGYGLKLWNKAIEALQGHNIGLDGVVDQQPNYKKSGFKLAYRNIRYEGIIKAQKHESKNVIPADIVSIEKICEYDRKCFPVTRDAFLQCWLAMPESKSVVYLEKKSIAGYGSIRKCRNGYKIGPLFANSAKIAEELLNSLAGYAKDGSNIYLDVPEVNPSAVALAENHGMKKVFETARMYTWEEPKLCVDCIFGVTTFELG